MCLVEGIGAYNACSFCSGKSYESSEVLRKHLNVRFFWLLCGHRAGLRGEADRRSNEFFHVQLRGRAARSQLRMRVLTWQRQYVVRCVPSVVCESREHLVCASNTSGRCSKPALRHDRGHHAASVPFQHEYIRHEHTQCAQKKVCCYTKQCSCNTRIK